MDAFCDVFHGNRLALRDRFCVVCDLGSWFPSASRYQRTVGRIQAHKQPFWIVCGYGGAGNQVIRFMDQSGIRSVMIESNQTRADTAKLSDMTYDLDVLVGDASEPQTLVDAGVQSALCRGVLALTDHNQTNLTIATNTRILAPRVACPCSFGERCQYP